MKTRSNFLSFTVPFLLLSLCLIPAAFAAQADEPQSAQTQTEAQAGQQESTPTERYATRCQFYFFKSAAKSGLGVGVMQGKEIYGDTPDLARASLNEFCSANAPCKRITCENVYLIEIVVGSGYMEDSRGRELTTELMIRRAATDSHIDRSTLTHRFHPIWDETVGEGRTKIKGYRVTAIANVR